VINGFSDLVIELAGKAGAHARSAVGMAELPFDPPVEVEAEVPISPSRGPGRPNAPSARRRGVNGQTPKPMSAAPHRAHRPRR